MRVKAVSILLRSVINRAGAKVSFLPVSRVTREPRISALIAKAKAVIFVISDFIPFLNKTGYFRFEKPEKLNRFQERDNPGPKPRILVDPITRELILD